MTSWSTWLAAAWPILLRGGRVTVPTDVALEGWRIPRAAASMGQSSDLVQPMRDGSRVHVHVLPNGARIAHRDRIDPGRGPLHAVAHVLTETPTGRMLSVGLATRGLWRLLF